MERRPAAPGPYRATELWNEITRYFRAGVPLRTHRQHFRKHGSCFTASEAADWLHEALRNNSNFGPEVSRQQTVQLLRKFLKNHVIEDIKGRWGSESLEDNGALYRFPSTSPVKPLPASCRQNENLGTFPRDRLLKLPHLSRRTPKKHELLRALENVEKTKLDKTAENEEDAQCRKEVSQECVQETWRNIILIHLQTILGLPSLEAVLQPTQIVPEHVIYNMTHTSKHGVVILQNKSEDLPHWVLSAMKCLAYWPRNNDMSQPTYSGFERDVFRTVADYFLNLPEPLLTFEYYELFVNILVMCGFITIPNKCNGKHSVRDETCDPQPSKILHLNSFKSTECLLLSLLRKEPKGKKEEYEASWKSSSEELAVQTQRARKLQQCELTSKRGSAGSLIGGSCQNLSGFRNEQDLSLNLKTRCYSLERIGNAASRVHHKGESNSLRETNVLSTRNKEQWLPCVAKTESVLEFGCENARQKRSDGSKRVSASVLQDRELFKENLKSKQICRSQSLLGSRNSRSCTSINAPVAEITVKPRSQFCGQGRPNTSAAASVGIRTEVPDVTISQRLCRSTTALSECSFAHSYVLTGTQSLLQPHLERIAVEALQICCLLLPPPNRRKMQLLVRMMARISENVDMPRLHDAMGTRSLMIQTFSRCVLCCAEEVDLDELLSTRLVSFLMDHQQEIFKVPTYLQAAVQDHIEHMKMAQCNHPGEEICAILPTYSYCEQITPQEFEEQKVSTSQAAVAELLENIIKDKNLSVKEKKKKLKQFQKEYPLIYQNRFPTTENEAVLFENKPTIKQPMLSLRKPKFRSLRY
ncbi:DEP domain-containing protein 1A isoform X1 [Centrocercus urophasianus]|uniref:DEP domain-containing protein 1A isoform X1 n=1 Tax=Centrocercus urophasianus TaxID=9002 RepID=UPI001C653F45|nr:DEP domain-containing protein 1A isoform X1 [Centrocercus urophasianus]